MAAWCVRNRRSLSLFDGKDNEGRYRNEDRYSAEAHGLIV